MKLPFGLSAKNALAIVLAVAGVAAATGVAFAAWMNNTDGIFLSMVEAGLAWCM